MVPWLLQAQPLHRFRYAHTHTCSHTRSRTRTRAQRKHLRRFRTFSRGPGLCRVAAHGAGLPCTVQDFLARQPFPSHFSVHIHFSHVASQLQNQPTSSQKAQPHGTPFASEHRKTAGAIGSYDSRWSAHAPNLHQEACHSVPWDPALLHRSWVHNSKCVDPP